MVYRAYTTEQLHRAQRGIAVSLTIFRLKLRTGTPFEARDWLPIEASMNSPRKGVSSTKGASYAALNGGGAGGEVVTKGDEARLNTNTT
jgi:hypothetical protein